MTFFKLITPKMLLLAAFAVTSTSAIASSSAKKPFTGPFAFARAGGVMLKGEHVITSSNGTGKDAMQSIGFNFGGGGGYITMTDKKVIMGAEAYLDMYAGKCNKNLNTNQREGKVSIQHKYAYGVGVIAGAAANPKLIMYAKTSLEFNTFELKYSELTGQAQPSESYKKTVKGIVPGAGALYRLSDSFLVGGEYTYAILTKVEPRSNSGTPARTFTFKPAEHRANVRLMWIF